MEKFSIIPGRVSRGLTDVQYNESPRCRLLISDLNINDAYEGDTDNLIRIFDYIDDVKDGDGFYYWAEITLVSRRENGNYEKVMEECWAWWLALQIRNRDILDLSES